ncbi:hypothetical protein BGZ83_010182 [Gryganskiella cystojenkinii]|nr:hypothetical protein BGZ83_010182 [Gryganskiella cystojenkinii]
MTMADHPPAPYSSSNPSSSSASTQQRSSHHLHQHHAHFQVQQRHPYSHHSHHHHHHQDYHGPLSAGVVEGGHRAFPSFHGSLHHPYPHSLHHSHSQTFGSSTSNNNSSSATTASASGSAPTQSLASTSASNNTHNNNNSGSSAKSLSVADILERYQDASKDFLVTVLNAKAKEDERKAEEERYKTEQIKLQSKQLELDLIIEKRRGSPPAANRPYSVQYSESHATSSSSPYYRGSYNQQSQSQQYTSTAGEISRNNNKHSHHEHHAHESQEHSKQQQPQSQQQQQQQQQHQDHPMQSPSSGRPFLKINTSFRSYQPQPNSSQRLPPSPAHTTLPPLPATNPGPKSSNRHYGLQALSSSAQSSPVAVLDYQSHIPPPYTPKDDQQTSPTSALSPTQGLKRKSINHDAVMDAVRAKVLRNAGQNQQQKKAAEQAAAEREQANGRRKVHHGGASINSPERVKKYGECLATVPESAPALLDSTDLRKVKVETTQMSSLPLSSSSASPPISPSSGGNNGNHHEEHNHNSGSIHSNPSSRSRSSSPPLSSKAQTRRQTTNPTSDTAIENEAEAGPASSSRADYHAENGVLVQ